MVQAIEIGRQPLDAAEREAVASRIRGIAARFLSRWNDPLTVSLLDDLAQLATLDTLAAYGRLCDERCLPGFVRTIARRVRFRVLRRERERRDAGRDFPLEPACSPAEPPRVRVCARWIESEALLPWLADALERLPPLNSQLLREYYGGSSCRDLARRHRLTPDTVKVRLHRSRERVRASLERRVRRSLL